MIITTDPEDSAKVTISNTCFICEVGSSITVDFIKYERWAHGEFVQDVWPELSEDDRELILTGTHQGCWDQLQFEEEDDVRNN